MRRFVPDSLAAWALLILIGGLTVAEIATLGTILQNRVINTRMTGFFHLAERVSSVSRAIAAQPEDQRAALASALSSPTLQIKVELKPTATTTSGSDEEIAELEDIMQARLAESGITEVDVQRIASPVETVPDDLAEDAGPVERFLSDIGERYAGDNAYAVSVQLGDGAWVNVTIPVAPLPRLWSTEAILLTTFVIALMLAASIWALRRLTAPYTTLANAAERFGRDLNAPPLPERGPREVCTAAHAFNLMQERLKRFLSDRDQLVAAISHDIRTPTTRLRLRAEFVEDVDQRRRMLADLDDIETMTRSVLAFARDSAEPEPRETLDLISLLETLCGDINGMTLELPPTFPLRLAYTAQPVGLRRCIANLLDNAVKYGGCARVAVEVGAGAIRILVDDDGPGIPDAEKELVFRPFRRLESSRNRETGGTGLGLTIARTVARAHGGDVILTNRYGGGLRVELVLPLATAATVPARVVEPA